MNRKGFLGFVVLILVLIFALFIAFNFLNEAQFPKKYHLAESNYDYSIKVNGSILTTNKSVVCVSGYSKSVRDVPLSLRKQVFKRDNVSYPQPMGTTELDHAISLELGGSNNADNLFVQWSDDFVGVGNGYESKDKIENYLHRQVCYYNNMSLEEAQYKIIHDWHEIYSNIYG